VLAGVTRYADPLWPPLPAVGNNLDDLGRLLADPLVWGLPASNCRVIVDPRDDAEILAAIHEAGDTATDTVLFYFAGHGFPLTRDLMLPLASTTARSRLYQSLRYSAVRDQLQARLADHAVVIVDSCFSGLAATLSDAEADGLIDSQINETSAYVLASSARDSVSMALPGERCTVFTGELLALVAGGIDGAGERLSLAHVARALSWRLRTRRMPTPRYSQEGEGGQLALFGNRRWRPPDRTRPRDAAMPDGTPRDAAVPAGTPQDRPDYGVDFVAANVRQLFGPRGRAVTLLDGQGREVLCADAPAVVAHTRLPLPGAAEGVRLMAELTAAIRDHTGDGAATGVLIAERLIAGLRRHPDPGRRRGLADGCRDLAQLLAARLAEAARPVTTPAGAAALAATAGLDDDLRSALRDLPSAADARAFEVAAADPELGPDPDPDPDSDSDSDSDSVRLRLVRHGTAMRVPVRVLWPDLPPSGAVLDNPAVVTIADAVEDLADLTRLPADRPLLVLAARLGLTVRRSLHAIGRPDWFVAEPRAADSHTANAVVVDLARVLGTPVTRSVPEAVKAGPAVPVRRIVIRDDVLELARSGRPAPGGGAGWLERTRAGVTLVVARDRGEGDVAFAGRMQRLRRLPAVLAAGLRGGVVAGGGTALRWYGSRLAAARSDPDLAGLFDAVAAPADCLRGAATVDTGRLSGAWAGFDARTGQVTDLATAGVVDSAAVVAEAVLRAADVAVRYARQG
jgi:hypothetical protein